VIKLIVVKNFKPKTNLYGFTTNASKT